MASFVHYISELYYRAKRYKSIPARYIVPSAFSRQVLIDAGFHAGEIVTLPTFAPNRLFGIKRNIDCNKPYKLLYVGNMQEYKGNRVAVQLMPLLRDAYGDRVQLLMAGDGPDMSYNKSYIQDYSLEDSIQLLGHIESTKVEELYSTSYAILIPSLCYENLPNTLIEAMSSGLPVIGSDHGSIREHIVNGDNGLLATPNNITAWFKAACSVIEDSGLSERISSSSRTYAKQHFSESVHMLKLIKILEVIQSKS